MGSINLDEYSRTVPQQIQGNLRPRVLSEDAYKYKDIKLDLGFEIAVSNLPDSTPESTRDLTDLRNIQDVKQALLNLLTTVPGQKLLNPNFGLNLSHYCFEPITRITADHIARTILIEVPRQEPRLSISNLNVIGDIEEATYEIEFGIYVEELDNQAVTFKGLLNSDGFKFVYSD